MHKIERRTYGIRLTFAEMIDLDEMQRWVDEAKRALIDQRGSFGVLVDMRELKPLKPEVQAKMVEGQREFKLHGMERSAVGVASSIIAIQFKRLAQESGIYKWERYLDASQDPNWEKSAEGWISHGIDPDR